MYTLQTAIQNKQQQQNIHTHTHELFAASMLHICASMWAYTHTPPTTTTKINNNRETKVWIIHFGQFGLIIDCIGLIIEAIHFYYTYTYSSTRKPHTHYIRNTYKHIHTKNNNSFKHIIIISNTNTVNSNQNRATEPQTFECYYTRYWAIISNKHTKNKKKW